MLYIIKAVQERKLFVDEILKKIPNAIVYYDKEHDAQKSYLYICENIIKQQPCVLLQDDIILTENFQEKIEKIIQQYPNMLISFFDMVTGKQPVFREGKKFRFSQCVYHPPGFSKKVLESYPKWKYRNNPVSYCDKLMGFAWGEEQDYLLWIPSLVQHRSCISAINEERSRHRISPTFIP